MIHVVPDLGKVATMMSVGRAEKQAPATMEATMAPWVACQPWPWRKSRLWVRPFGLGREETRLVK